MTHNNPNTGNRHHEITERAGRKEIGSKDAGWARGKKIPRDERKRPGIVSRDG